jgi:hypothetical protein
MRTLRLVARSVRIEYPGTVYHAMWPGDWSVQYATYNYLKDGKPDYQDYVNGVHTAFGYDPRGFLRGEGAGGKGSVLTIDTSRPFGLKAFYAAPAASRI